MMTIIFIFLCIAVALFLLMTCLTLFRIERTAKSAEITAERTIVKMYGRKSA